jgi:hypothetical protein
VAGLALAFGGKLRRREFWLTQLAHQAPMMVSMALMLTVLRSTPGILLLVAGLWIVALARLRAARTSNAAQEFIVDVLAMALVLGAMVLSGSPAASGVSGASAMPGMGVAGPFSPGLAIGALAVAGWAGLRLWMLAARKAPDDRIRGLVSGSCCALGLAVMIAF